MGGLARVQWTNENNIALGKESMRFIREIESELAVLGERKIDIDFTPQGTLLLGRQEDQAHMLESYYTQEKVGAKCRLYRGRKLRETFPWLNTNDIDMASYSLEEEGFFNTRELLEAFKRNNLSKGIKYVKGEVTRFHPLHADYDPDLSEHPGVRRNPGRMQMLGEKAGGKSYATIQTPAGKRPIHHRVNECSIKVDDWPIDIPIQFFRSVIATGSSTAAFVQQSGLSLDEVSDLPIEAGGESAYTQNFHKSLFPIQKRVRNNFLVFCPDMPVL